MPKNQDIGVKLSISVPKELMDWIQAKKTEKLYRTPQEVILEVIRQEVLKERKGKEQD